MKKNIHIQLSKYGFFMEEDAYNILQAWFDKIKSNLEGEPYREEIIQDLELRLAELWFDKHKNQTTVTISDVRQAIDIIGDPENIREDKTSDNNTDNKTSAFSKTTKRLYRDPDDFVIGGVCSGIAAYFNMDPVIVRLIAILLVFLAGTSFWVYLILWIIIPEAKTISQKLEMKGESLNWNNLKDELSKKARNLGQESRGFFKRIRKSPQTKNILYSIVNVLGIIIGGISLFVGVILFISLLGVIISSLSIFSFSNHQLLITLLGQYISFFWTKIWLYFLLGSLFLFFTYTGMKLAFKIRGSKWAYPFILGLFLISAIGLGFQALYVMQYLKKPKHYSETFTFRPLSDTLLVKSDHLLKNEEQFKDVTLDLEGINGYYLKFVTNRSGNDDIKMIVPVKILRTSDSVLKFKVEYNIFDKKTETIKSKPEEHFLFEDKKTLVLKTFFETDNKFDLFKIKNYTLYVPEKIHLFTDTIKKEIFKNDVNLTDNENSNEISIVLDEDDILKITSDKNRVRINGKIVNLEVNDGKDNKKIKIKINEKKKDNEAGN